MAQQSAHQPAHRDINSEYERQIHWEMQSVDRGAERYRGTLTRERKDGTLTQKNVAELRPGSIIIKDIVSRAEAGIAKEQADLVDYLDKNVVRKWQEWWFPFLSVPAGQIAYIGAKAILQGASDPKTATLTSIALQIGRELKTQREFVLWKEHEQEREREVREMKKAGDMDPDQYVPNWWKLMYQMSDQSARAYRKFAKKSEKMIDVGWTYPVRLGVGTKVIESVYLASGGWFEVRDAYVKGMLQKEIKLSSEAWGWIEDQHSKNELLRPWLLPMRLEPLDWVRREGTTERSDAPV